MRRFVHTISNGVRMAVRHLLSLLGVVAAVRPPERIRNRASMLPGDPSPRTAVGHARRIESERRERELRAYRILEGQRKMAAHQKRRERAHKRLVAAGRGGWHPASFTSTMKRQDSA